MRRRLGSALGAALLLWWPLGAVVLADSTGEALEVRVRAAFLFNFARFTEWPTAHFAAEPHFDFCVAGDPALAAATRSAVAGKLIHGQAARLQIPERAEQARDCELLYLASASEAWAPVLRGQPLLLVGEGRDFARSLGAIGFRPQDGRLRFVINPASARDARLSISSRLLDLAEIVTPEGD